MRQKQTSYDFDYKTKQVTNVETCMTSGTSEGKPTLIQTEALTTYLPFDEHYSVNLKRETIFVKFSYPDFTLKTGQIHNCFDGKRIIYEIGCNHAIYLLLNPNSPNHCKYFIQDIIPFADDVTNKTIAHEVIKNVGPIRTIIKYEMYFLMGMISTLSLPALVLVVGSDVTVSSLMLSAKVIASKKLSTVLLTENNNIKTHAPTLHKKIAEYLAAESAVKWDIYGGKLAENVVTNEKAQAQLAGVLIGKATLSPSAFTGWSALISILISASVTSATQSLSTYSSVIDERYRPIIEKLLKMDLNNPAIALQAANEIQQIMQENGVNISRAEASMIIREAIMHSNELKSSLVNIHTALNEFTRATKNAG